MYIYSKRYGRTHWRGRFRLYLNKKKNVLTLKRIRKQEWKSIWAGGSILVILLQHLPWKVCISFLHPFVINWHNSNINRPYTKMATPNLHKLNFINQGNELHLEKERVKISNTAKHTRNGRHLNNSKIIDSLPYICLLFSSFSKYLPFRICLAYFSATWLY